MYLETFTVLLVEVVERVMEPQELVDRVVDLGYTFRPQIHKHWQFL